MNETSGPAAAVSASAGAPQAPVEDKPVGVLHPAVGSVAADGASGNGVAAYADGPGGGTNARTLASPTADTPGDAVGAAQVEPVLAAGVLCWRRGAHELEVLMVHRPRYRDWSFPKGKLEDRELLPVCAVRELAEETGVLARLGRPLPQVCYPDARGLSKQVSYWAGTTIHARLRTASASEIDDVAWVPLSEAGARLTNPGDRVPLDTLARFAAAGELETSPVLVVRHATARPRDAWARADADRPLVAAGRRQAQALVALLDCWRPENVVSSPWRRCLQTLAPWVEVSGARVRTKGGLSERGFRRSAGKASKHITALVDRGRPALLCTHRPVLEGVMRTLARLTVVSARKDLPTSDPYLAPSEVLVTHVRRSGLGRPVVAVEQHAVLR